MNASNEQLLAEYESVHGYVARVCFKNGPPGRVGAELEWLVAPTEDPRRHIEPRSVFNARSAAAPLPGGSRLSLEPGGQVELSSQVAPDLNSCWRDLDRDVSTLDSLLSQQQLIRLPTAIDPWRRPIRYVHSPRYDAMQSYFERAGGPGLVMMTSTAAIQVNLDAGNDPGDVGRRWLLAHAIGPTLVAAFANSPIHRGQLTGWKSTRQRVWSALDSARTRPVIDAGTTAADPVASWAEYALNAPVMMLRRPGRWLPAPGFTFSDWVNGLTAFGRPSEDDLAYHLTTLFPPVRPRGWLEIRYLDAQPLELWPVPIVVVTALLEDPVARESALEASEPVRDSWGDAAQFGLTSPPLARAAMRCFEAAIAALPRLRVDPSLVALVEWFAEYYVARHRSPADSPIEPDDAGYPQAGGEKVHR